jgi:hypothetical protein
MNNIYKIICLSLVISSMLSMNLYAKSKNQALTPNDMKCENKLIIGEKEKVYFPTYKIKMDARIDTGATTTSIDARNIKLVEKDGKKWVKFEIVNRKTKEVIKVEKPLVRIVNIKRHETESQKRYVVKIRINLGSISQYTAVTLVDRSDYDFPVLIGRNFLSGVALVDVTKSYTLEPITKDK